MKRNILKFFLLLVTSIILLVGCTSNQTTAPGQKTVYEFKMNVNAPPTHLFMTDIVEPWVRFVEEESNGQIKISVFPSGVLGSLSTAYEDIRGGVYELGNVNP